MNPYIMSQLAASHVSDLRAQADAARRVRLARRTRRSRAGTSAPAGHGGGRPQPCAT